MINDQAGACQCSPLQTSDMLFFGAQVIQVSVPTYKVLQCHLFPHHSNSDPNSSNSEGIYIMSVGQDSPNIVCRLWEVCNRCRCCSKLQTQQIYIYCLCSLVGVLEYAKVCTRSAGATSVGLLLQELWRQPVHVHGGDSDPTWNFVKVCISCCAFPSRKYSLLVAAVVNSSAGWLNRNSTKASP